MLSGYNTDSRGLAWLHPCLADERAEFAVTFNPLRDSFPNAPEEVYARLRDGSPVHYSRLLDCWVVTRYEDVDHLLREDGVFRSDPRSATQDLIDPYTMLDPDRPSLFMLDPPGHTRLRTAVRGAFGPQAMRRLTPRLKGGPRPARGELRGPVAMVTVDATQDEAVVTWHILTSLPAGRQA
ncbi:hypothetical protein [Streptomyces camelliae]|uniref:Cytochrome P450 n=1 Tax=Streptomyces camelliae TaxID=3004093 RepID=A0ABY7PG69_9ACTN|nr:hypothetical protein [Streptomyces sp. HUAS 2-6]WBO69639.1 hypothetical protein O1G22_43650 [Streptomyces sp. HUAS 2-6]